MQLTQAERLFKEMCAAAIELQALALRMSKCPELSKGTRAHAEHIAQAGRTVALACVALNHGKNPRELTLFYGVFLSQRSKGESVDPCALNEPGVSDTKTLAAGTLSERTRGVPQPRQTLAALAERRARLHLNTAAAVPLAAELPASPS